MHSVWLDEANLIALPPNPEAGPRREVRTTSARWQLHPRDGLAAA
jgi:hypothetical protein